jgi:4-amino-4-deoxy-L-arabinose transferase-like glycosyltransferase
MARSTLWSLRWPTLIVTFVAICAVHGPLIGYKVFANVDEAYAGAIAARLLDGHKLYVGAVSQRGPLMYYLYEVIAYLHGWDNIVALRVWALGVVLLNVATIYWAGRALLSKDAALVAVAASAYAFTYGFPAADAYALHGEPLQLPALVVSVVLGARAIRARPGSRDRRLWLLGSGFFFGAAFAIKQSVALHPIALLVGLFADARRRRVEPRRWIADGLACVGGLVVVPAAFLVHAWAQGTLDALVYYCWTYNRTIHLAPTKKVFPWLAAVFQRLGEDTLYFLLLGVLAGFAVPWLWRRARAAVRARSLGGVTRGFGVRHYIAVHFALAVFAASVMYRFFPHYYVQTLPFLALAVGGLVARWMRRARNPLPGRTAFAGFLVFVLFCAGMGAYFGERVDGEVAHDRAVKDTAKLIEATTKPTDRIFVWGFSPWLYQYSHRKPAGRYVFETYVTGFVPWFWDKLSIEKPRIVPGSVEALLGDLDREEPEIIVDAGSVMMARSMRAYQAPGAWLKANYCFEVRLGPFDLYRRKRGGADCALSYFPRVHQTITWTGALLPFPAAMPLDWATARRLPDGHYNKPLWFPEGPRPPGVDVVHNDRYEKEEKDAEQDGFYIPKMEAEPNPPGPGGGN